MSNLPPDPYDRTVIVETDPNNPDRAPLAGTGRDIVVSMNPPTVVGREKMFLASDGKWVPFTTTDFTSWGSILGNIEDQADLMAMFALYPKTDTLAPVAFTGDYNQLVNKPPLGTVSPIDLDGLSSHFLRGDGTWAIPVDVTAVWGNINGNINAQTDLMTLLNLKAPLLSPALTGTPTAPTPPVDDSTTRIATTAWFFGQAFNASPLMNNPTASSGNSTLWARGNHVHPTDTTRAPLDSPAFINLPTAPTPPVNNNTQRLATTAFVLAQIAAAGLVPPPSDGNYYAFRNGAWVAFNPGAEWDNAG